MSTDLGEYGSGEEPTYPPPIRRRTRLTRRHLAAVPLVLLLVEGAVLGGRIQARHRTDADPARVASDFFTAVETDHAAEAAALTRLPANVDTRFTSADLLAEGGITRSMVTGTARHGDQATVTVAYTVAGFPAHSNLVLARTYTGFLHDPTWRIIGGLPVVHIRAAPFETASNVNGRSVALNDGSADVTVFPGLVTVHLPALLPAGDDAATVSATSDGAVVRFPATLDASLGHDLEQLVYQTVVAMNSGDLSTTGSVDLDFHLGDDRRQITFSGTFPFGVWLDHTTGAVLSESPVLSVSGTATYGDGNLTITALHVS